MGYTHYWTLGAFIEEKAYKTALKECRKIIRSSPVPLANWDSRGKPTLRNGFNFNGPGENGCENFAMSVEPDRENWFCKTRREPYDVVVTACLCVMRDRLGENINVRSDGLPHEWEDGRKFACKILKRDIDIPPVVLRAENFIEKYRKTYFREEHPEYGPYIPMKEKN